MKTRKSGDRTTIFVMGAIVLLVALVLVRHRLSISVPQSAESLEQQRRVLLLYHTDYEELLKAGREILSRGPKDLEHYIYLGPMHINGFPVPRGIPIPKVIRKLRPYATLINFNGFTFVQMKEGVVGFGVKIYPEGFKPPPSPFEYGNRELIPGLWYFDEKYDTDSEYDRKIDEVIKKGKWEEPNHVDLTKSSN
jgi:hypothetical protein